MVFTVLNDGVSSGFVRADDFYPQEKIVIMRKVLTLMILLCVAHGLAASVALAQADNSRYSLACRNEDNYGGDERARHC